MPCLIGKLQIATDESEIFAGVLHVWSQRIDGQKIFTFADHIWFQIRHRCTLERLYAFKLVSRAARELSESFSSNPGPYLMSFDPSVLICGNLYIWFQIRHRCTLEGLYAFKLVSRDARELSESFSSNPGPYFMSFDPSVLISGNLCLWFQKRHRCTL